MRGRGAWIIASMLIILVIIVLFIFRPTTCGVSPIETYANVAFCPEKTKYYISSRGDEECCDGEISGDRCIGKRVCTMSSSMTSIPSCKEIMSTYFSEKAVRVCPKEMPNYYEGDGGATGYCTASKLTPDMKPIYSTAPSCTVYKNGVDNMSKADSCYNQKQLSDMKCLTSNCTKALVKGGRGGFLVQQTYKMPDRELPRTCIGRASAIADGAVTAESTDTNICENAQRIFIERRAPPA